MYLSLPCPSKEKGSHYFLFESSVSRFPFRFSCVRLVLTPSLGTRVRVEPYLCLLFFGRPPNLVASILATPPPSTKDTATNLNGTSAENHHLIFVAVSPRPERAGTSSTPSLYPGVRSHLIEMYKSDIDVDGGIR